VMSCLALSLILAPPVPRSPLRPASRQQKPPRDAGLRGIGLFGPPMYIGGHHAKKASNPRIELINLSLLEEVRKKYLDPHLNKQVVSN